MSSVIGNILGNAIHNLISDLLFPNQWGIFDEYGIDSILQVDTVLEVTFKNENIISTYPIQEGGFVSYDKVETPYTGTVSVALGGYLISSMIDALIGVGSGTKSDLLDTLDSLVKDTELYTIVTPDKVFEDCNIIGYSFKRSKEDGAYLLKCDIMFMEVRKLTASYTDTTEKPQSESTSSSNSSTAPASSTPNATPSAAAKP